MVKLKKLLFVSVCFAFLIVLAFACTAENNKRAYAEDCEPCNFSEENGDGGIQPYALESLSVLIGGGNGIVRATAKNKFQVGHSTVQVYVKLYYSYSYCENYNQMTLAASNYIGDLDSGNSISAEASTGGEERFWLALVQYKVNSGVWKEKTVTARYSASGDFISKN